MRRVELPQLTSAAVDDAVRRFTEAYEEAMEAYAWEGPIVASQLWAQAAGETARWLWTAAMRAIIPKLDGADSCFFLPGGRLSLLPWQAAEDGDESVLDHTVLRYLPASAFALKKQQRWSRFRLNRAEFVGIGPHRDDLSGSKEELCSIHATYFPHAPEPLLGPASTSDALVRLLPQASVLHVASHGELLDRSDPRSAALLLADGPLRILEIEVRRELQARRPLVILAACESAATGDYAVDEIVGLPLAWMEAGAGAVIANQWSVGDKPMRKLLGTFYERWLDEGRAPWQALGDAMRQARRETGWSGAGSDPASWAALTFWG